MPNLDETVNVPVVWTYTRSWYFTGPFDLLQSYGYADLPLRVYRVTTNRNSPSVTGVRSLTTCKRPFLYDWYRQKPIRFVDIDGSRESFKSFQVRRMDWRAKKPVKDPNYIPPGWEAVKLPNGKYEVRLADLQDSRSLFLKYEAVPQMTRVLRPLSRKWRRNNPSLPFYIKNNDLTYCKTTDTAGGWMRTVLANSLPHASSYVGQLNHDGPFWGSSALFSLPYSPLIPSEPAFGADASNLEVLCADEIERLSHIALNRHYQKLKNQKVDLATELSQQAQTVSMVGELASRLAKTFTLLKSGRLLDAYTNLLPKNSKGVANDYLMWTYGIKPLIADIQGAAQHVADWVMKAAAVKSNGHATGGFVQNVVADYVDGNTLYRTFRFYKIRVKYGSSFHVSDSLTHQASQLGFTNPANTIWELVPFSFVVDWFLPIGDFLQNLTALDGLTLVESYKTIFIEYYETVLVSNISSLDDTGILFDGKYLLTPSHFGYKSRQMTYCRREVVTLPDVPTPRWKNPFSTGHLANAIALLTQLSSSKGK